MSSPYDRYEGRRGVWTHWVPLILTVTVATAGVAGWIWSQRDRDDEDSENDALLYRDLDYENADENTRDGAAGAAGGADAWGAQVSEALRHTPSPQQFLDSARKTVAAGVTTARVAVGSVLASVREEEKPAHADRETGRVRTAGSSRKKRRAVALVVSAESHGGYVDASGFLEHASLLSHIPRHNDMTAVKIYVLIYAPGLTDASLDAAENLPSASLSSSFSNIEHNQTHSQGEEKSLSLVATSSEPAFKAVYSEALGLVEKETMVLPFTTPNGYAYMLRHLQPDVIYLQASLAGHNGAVVTQMQSWLRHDLVLVVGAEGGHGGLADSESEGEAKKEDKWWLMEDRVGRGRGVVVVDGMRLQDDWVRRVQGKS